MDSGDHQIRALIFVCLQQVIKSYNGQASQRQQKNQPWMRASQSRGQIHAEIKGASRKSDDDPQ